jgi:glycyl-tRNA synthetase beta chain
MPELLLEIFCEEIPARMQARAAADLERLLSERLGAEGLAPKSTRAFAGPRRLTAVLDGLPAKAADVREERKGPRVDAPKQAIDGFLRSAGLSRVEQCETREDKKGAYYVAVIEREGFETAAVVADVLPELLRQFPWPKSMRWGADAFRWVRPVHRILCVFDGEVLSFESLGVKSGDQTEGHRLLGPGPFKARSFADYVKALEGPGGIVLDPAKRRATILADAERLCAEEALELVEDPGLLEEVAGLVERPVVLLGRMDPSFLDLPPEVIRLTMRTHQKYFAVRDPASGGLAPRFVVVANQVAPDGGAAIAEGNARVLSARLNDARYFWDQDRRKPLAEMAKGLKDIVFHQKLGSVADKVERVAALARELAPTVGADPDLAERAARLAKADLVSGMVGEFPELQGVMGRYYAQGQGEDPKVADAIRDHYKPLGPSDVVPSEPTAIAVALADKLDTLGGFWAVNEKPSGSGDPYALRRAALGVIRIQLFNKTSLSMRYFSSLAYLEAGITSADKEVRDANRAIAEVLREVATTISNEEFMELLRHAAVPGEATGDDSNDPRNELEEAVRSLLSFFADRLKVHLRDEGHRHDLVDAVFALGEDDLVLIVKRVEALGRFLDMDDGAQLLAAYRRAANILRDEEKKDGQPYEGEPIETLLLEPEEVKLHAGLIAARPKVDAALKAEDFEAAMAALAPLRPVIDAFFERVMVNAPDASLRRNRLLLLSRFRDALSGVADFSKLAG